MRFQPHKVFTQSWSPQFRFHLTHWEQGHACWYDSLCILEHVNNHKAVIKAFDFFDTVTHHHVLHSQRMDIENIHQNFRIIVRQFCEDERVLPTMPGRGRLQMIKQQK